MIQWALILKYRGKKFTLKATVEYSSRQVLRIRVEGQKSTLLLQNDYPAIRFNSSKRGVRWKIREGALPAADKDSAQLLVDIFTQLEYLMKKDFEQIYPSELF